MRRPEFIAGHGGMPAGWLGRLVASIMEGETKAINRHAIALLDPQVGEAVLDIGTGHGLSLRHLASRMPEVEDLVISCSFENIRFDRGPVLTTDS